MTKPLSNKGFHLTKQIDKKGILSMLCKADRELNKLVKQIREKESLSMNELDKELIGLYLISIKLRCDSIVDTLSKLGKFVSWCTKNEKE